MTKTIETKSEQLTLDMAPEIKPFLDGDYFKGLCEIAAACHTKKELYIPQATQGIFNSLYFKRIFARKQNEETKAWIVGNFQMKNRFLYNWDRLNRTYGDKKEDNYNRFVEQVNSIVKSNDYKIFSLTPVVNTADDLDNIIA